MVAESLGGGAWNPLDFHGVPSPIGLSPPVAWIKGTKPQQAVLVYHSDSLLPPYQPSIHLPPCGSFVALLYALPTSCNPPTSPLLQCLSFTLPSPTSITSCASRRASSLDTQILQYLFRCPTSRSPLHPFQSTVRASTIGQTADAGYLVESLPQYALSLKFLMRLTPRLSPREPGSRVKYSTSTSIA